MIRNGIVSIKTAGDIFHTGEDSFERLNDLRKIIVYLRLREVRLVDMLSLEHPVNNPPELYFSYKEIITSHKT